MPDPLPTLTFHLLQFEDHGLLFDPIPFTSEADLLRYLSDHLAAPKPDEFGSVRPLFPRLPDESPDDHLHAFFDCVDSTKHPLRIDRLFDAATGNAPKPDSRNGSFDWDKSTVHIWTLTFTPSSKASRPA